MEKEKTVLEILAQLEREAAGAESDDTATWNPEPGDQRSGIILRFEEVQTRNGPRWVLEIESATVGVFPFWPGVIPLRKLRNQRAAPGDGVVIKRLGMTRTGERLLGQSRQSAEN